MYLFQGSQHTGKTWKIREKSPHLFWRLEKRALILGEYALIAVIYELNFSFKVQFLRAFRRKTPFPAGAFFFLL